MRFIRLLRDFLLVHRRAVAGMCILIVAAALIVSFFGELQDSYRNLFHRQERNTAVVYLTYSALLVVAFLTSIFPASLFGVVGGMLFGVVTGFGLCAAALMAAALIAFVFARYFFRAASRRISAEVVRSRPAGGAAGPARPALGTDDTRFADRAIRHHELCARHDANHAGRLAAHHACRLALSFCLRVFRQRRRVPDQCRRDRPQRDRKSRSRVQRRHRPLGHRQLFAAEAYSPHVRSRAPLRSQSQAWPQS